MYGVDCMSSRDCMSYFGEYGPKTVEWINDSSCNVVFADKFTAKRAIFGMGKLLAEGSTESVFLVRDGAVLTPPLGRILTGISRMSVLEMADAAGVPAREEVLRGEDLFTADEIFTAHSGVKVHPVGRFEDRQLPVPGPVTAKLLEVVENTLNFSDDRFRHFFQFL